MDAVNTNTRRCAATIHQHSTINVLSEDTPAVHAGHLESVYGAVQQTSVREQQQRSHLA
jgi:hypothetical protein